MTKPGWTRRHIPLQQPVYLATANPNPRHPEDLFHLLAWTGAGEIADPAAAGNCSLEPLAATPVGAS